MGSSFQSRVKPWLDKCFGVKEAGNIKERNHRFLEEALELVQAGGCNALEAHQIVDYVYARKKGEINQEVGGVMTTLAALCLANDVDMHAEGETELARIWKLVDQIRTKQESKPQF
jgi:NTP pyrophosphatase (non-canonical NTP hydrolase)